jgi:gamma-glutamyltranspeptidase/glutathione hydrolase
MTLPHGHAFRPTVMGTRGCVAAAHPLAAMAGIQILLQGGTAVDAAGAVSFALHVVEPYMSGPGGVATLLLHRHGRREAVVSAGRMPAAANPAGVTADDLKGGARSIGVPGLVAAILGLHGRHGTLPRATVMAPAIRLAEDGFPLTWKNCEFLQKARPQLAHSAEAERTFLADGRVPPRHGPGPEGASGGTARSRRRVEASPGSPRPGRRADRCRRRAAGWPRPTWPATRPPVARR